MDHEIDRIADQKKHRQRILIFKTILVAVGALMGLLLAETGLRVFERIQLSDRATPATVPDPVLGHKMIPDSTGHDANGFRNQFVPQKADIVVLGDSQTWGVNVGTLDAWPQQLERLSGRTVYNMGVGGYGAVQYWALTDKALSFGPKTIVAGLYFGNDIYDAYSIVYSNDNYADARAVNASDELKVDTIQPKAQFYWDEEKSFHNSYGRSSPSGWSYWLRLHTAIGRHLNRAGFWPGATNVEHEIDKAWAHTYPDRGAIWENDPINTVFTTAYRETGLNLDDPRIQEGLRITNDMLWRMHQTLDTRGVRLIVLLIPTKELVYAELMQHAGISTGPYARLIEMESRARSEVMSRCSEKGIECVDALPALRRSLADGQPIYPSTTESHPNAAGYRVLAALMNEAMLKKRR